MGRALISIIDFETTGLLGKGKPVGITQIGLVRLDAGTLRDFRTASWELDPEIAAEDWWEGTEALTGFSPENVKGRPTFFEVFPSLAEEVRGSEFLTGYNINDYDIPVLVNQLKRYGFETNFPWPPRHIDVMDIVRQVYGKPRKLAEVHQELYGKHDKQGAAHDALGDCHMTADVIMAIGKEHFKT